jgi:hypothetical protein
MNKHLAMGLGLLLVTSALAGCGKSTKPASPLSTGVSANGATAVDIAQVSDQVTANPTLINENLYADPTPMNMLSGGTGLAAIRPLHWWRTIDSTSRSVQTTYSDPDTLGRPTAALVTITRHLVGKFNIVYGDTTPTDTTRRLIRKPLDDTWTRLLALHRFRFDTTNTRCAWRIVGTSGVLVTSANATTHIRSVRIQAGALDTTITDPLQLHRLRRLECLPATMPVHVTVTTGRNDDVVVLYRMEERRRFHNNGDNTYSLDFINPDFGGLRHFGVNALSNGTLFDDASPYDSQAWLVPFAVRFHDADVDHDGGGHDTNEGRH